jgi:signal transduction histidine kinase
VTVLIGLGLTHRLGILAAAAQQVGKGDYSIKIPIETADEVGRTADDLGLVEALKEELSTWQDRLPEIATNLDVAGNLDSLDERINITLYRIVQECLTNIARHADATRVSISLSGNIDKLGLSVSDNGRGLDQSLPSDGLGLIGMRERAEGLGGEFMLESKKGAGVTIRVRIPLHDEDGTSRE